MALKKLNSAKDKTTEKKSSMRVVKTAGSTSDTVNQVADMKEQIASYQKQIKALEGLVASRIEDIKKTAIKDMITQGSFDSVELRSEDEKKALGIIVMDKYAKISGNFDQVEKDISELVGADNAEKFLTYKQTVRDEAIQNEKVWDAFEKFADDVKKKFGVELIEQQLTVKPKALDNVLSTVKNKDDAMALLDILKPQINLTLK